MLSLPKRASPPLMAAVMMMAMTVVLMASLKAPTAVVHAQNPFSSNVVELTPQNWKSVVVDSPHAVFVNICRLG